jgi:lysozyme family protein
MKAMPLSVAKAIYKAEYWDKVHGDVLPAGPDLCGFDIAVNSGVGRQHSFHAALQDLKPLEYVKAHCKKRLSFLRGLRTFSTFGTGWTRRVADVEASSTKMVLQAQGTPEASIKQTLLDTGQSSSTKSKAQATATAAPGGAAATQAPTLPDVSQIDASTTAGLIFLGLVILGVTAFFAYRAYVNHHRAKAFAEAAKEV